MKLVRYDYKQTKIERHPSPVLDQAHNLSWTT
jgi:hypothetical protein